jgi:hypothetical protein
MFQTSLTNWLRKRAPVKTHPPRPTTRLRLEELEERAVPSAAPSSFVDTYPNVSVQITPNIAALTVTEKVTVSVTPFGIYNSSTGQTTQPPTNTPPAGGTVWFNLNNAQASATVNGNGQATATFKVPLLTFLSNQILAVQFNGFTDSSGNQFAPTSQTFPLYTNDLNVVLPSTLTFTQPTPQQLNLPSPSLAPFGAIAGEKDDFGFVSFGYVDPGVVNSATVGSVPIPAPFYQMFYYLLTGRVSSALRAPTAVTSVRG